VEGFINKAKALAVLKKRESREYILVLLSWGIIFLGVLFLLLGSAGGYVPRLQYIAERLGGEWFWTMTLAVSIATALALGLKNLKMACQNCCQFARHFHYQLYDMHPKTERCRRILMVFFVIKQGSIYRGISWFIFIHFKLL